MEELDLDELKEINGGFVYQGSEGNQLNGEEITCPYCNMDSKKILKTLNELSPNRVAFQCIKCKRILIYQKVDDKVKILVR